MALLFIGVLEEFLGDGLSMNAGGHIVMTLVAQDADGFSRQDFVEYADYGFPVGCIAAGDCALLHVLAGAAAEFLNVRYEGMLWFFSWLHFHGCALSVGIRVSSHS